MNTDKNIAVGKALGWTFIKGARWPETGCGNDIWETPNGVSFRDRTPDFYNDYAAFDKWVIPVLEKYDKEIYFILSSDGCKCMKYGVGEISYEESIMAAGCEALLELEGDEKCK